MMHTIRNITVKVLSTAPHNVIIAITKNFVRNSNLFASFINKQFVKTLQQQSVNLNDESLI